MLCALLCLAVLQPTLRSALPVDIPTDYPPLYSACPYYDLSILHLTIRSALSAATPADYIIYRLSALLYLAMLQPTMLCALLFSTLSSDTTSDYLLCFACRYSNRLSATLLCLSTLQLTIRSALSGVTPTDHPLDSLRRYSNRPSVVIFWVYRITTDFPIPLCLPSLQPTIHSAPRQRRHRFGARQSDYPLSSVWR
jgi:hypothetical protein